MSQFLSRKRAFACAMAATLLGNTFMVPQAFGADNTEFLQWGIRGTFNQYIGGPSYVGDGAELLPGKTTIFNFPLTSKKFNKEENRLEANFQGKIVYRGYCGNLPDAKPETKMAAKDCKLDLVFQNPSVVIDDDQDSYIEASVTSRQYPDGNYWRPEGRVRVVNLYPKVAGDFVDKDGNIEWKSIPSRLTEDGRHMISYFYPAEDAMDPASIAYKGEGKDFRDPNAVFASAKTWTLNESNERMTRTFEAGPNIIAAAGGNGIYLLNSVLDEITHVDANVSTTGVSTYDPRNQVLYYAEDKGDAIWAVSVDKKSLGTPVKVAEGHGQILALGTHPKTGKVVAVAQNDTDAIRKLSDEQPATLYTIDNGVVSTATLPTTPELVKQVDPNGVSDWSPLAYRGNNTETFHQLIKLLPMDDGTFVYVPYSELIFKTDGNNPKYKFNYRKGEMISIKPDATEPTEIAKLMPGSFYSEPLLDQVISDGTQIIRANNTENNSTSDSAFAQTLTYKDRDVTAVTGRLPLKELNGWGGGGYTAKGEPFMVSSGGADLAWFDPMTFKPKVNEKTGEERTLKMPNLRRTNLVDHGQIIARSDGTLYVPTVIQASADVEYYELSRVFSPSTFKPELEDNLAQQKGKEARVQLAKEGVKVAEQSIQDAQAELKKAEDANDSAAIEAAKKKLTDAQAELDRAKAVLKQAECDLAGKEKCGETSTPDPTNPQDPKDPTTPGQGSSPAPSDDVKYGLTAFSVAFGIFGLLGAVGILLRDQIIRALQHSPLASMLPPQLRHRG